MGLQIPGFFGEEDDVNWCCKFTFKIEGILDLTERRNQSLQFLAFDGHYKTVAVQTSTTEECSEVTAEIPGSIPGEVNDLSHCTVGFKLWRGRIPISGSFKTKGYKASNYGRELEDHIIQYSSFNVSYLAPLLITVPFGERGQHYQLNGNFILTHPPVYNHLTEVSCIPVKVVVQILDSEGVPDLALKSEISGAEYNFTINIDEYHCMRVVALPQIYSSCKPCTSQVNHSNYF